MADFCGHPCRIGQAAWSPPATEQAVSIDLVPGIARLDYRQLPGALPDRSSAMGTRPAPENCSLSHADGGAKAIQIHWNHAGKDITFKNTASHEDHHEKDRHLPYRIPVRP